MLRMTPSLNVTFRKQTLLHNQHHQQQQHNLPHTHTLIDILIHLLGVEGGLSLPRWQEHCPHHYFDLVPHEIHPLIHFRNTEAFAWAQDLAAAVGWRLFLMMLFEIKQEKRKVESSKNKKERQKGSETRNRLNEQAFSL